jgi:hypothetical protein
MAESPQGRPAGFAGRACREAARLSKAVIGALSPGL